MLRDEPLARADVLFTVETALPHGRVAAVLGRMRRLGLDTLLATKRSRARDVVLSIIVERVIHPCSKLATSRLWSTTTLGESLGVTDADVDELYVARDWLLARQPAIEQKLAARHLADGASRSTTSGGAPHAAWRGARRAGGRPGMLTQTQLD